jgi:hypothetical protein
MNPGYVLTPAVDIVTTPQIMMATEEIFPVGSRCARYTAGNAMPIICSSKLVPKDVDGDLPPTT